MCGRKKLQSLDLRGLLVCWTGEEEVKPDDGRQGENEIDEGVQIEGDKGEVGQLTRKTL